MKVLMIHEHGKAHGPGAVVAMYQLHRMLIAMGHESTIACKRRGLDEDEIVEMPGADRIEKLIGKVTWRLGLNDVHCISTFRLPKFQPFIDADVVHIHGWHSGYFNFLAVPRMVRHKPLISTLHDMWPLTGHCAQSFDCTRWQTGCGKCPYPKTYPPVQRDATAIEWRLKRWVYRRCDGAMHVVAPSRWLADIAQRSMLGHLPIHQVSNGIELESFPQRDRKTCRAEFGIPDDRKVILYIAASLNNHMKGGDLFVDAMHALPDELRNRCTLLLLGDNGDEVAQATGMSAIATGYVSDVDRKAMAFAAADVTVMPSRAETQGIVLMESMACGTPVAAFDVGGIGEVVETGPGGLLASPEDVPALARSIERLLSDDELNRSLAESGRAAVEQHYTTRRAAEQYVDIYRQAIEMHQSA